MPAQKKLVPQKKSSRRRPTSVGPTPQLVALANLVEGASAAATLPNTLRQALVDADMALRRATIERVPSADDYNYCLELILQRTKRSIEFKQVEKAVGGDCALVGVVCDASEQGLWLGMALAYRFFEARAR